MTRTDDDNRVRQIAAGVGILVALALVVCGTLVGWRYLPGLLGEWIGMMIGVMTTPFFLEASFIVIGLIVVFAVNHWRQRRDGDELVYMDRMEGGETPTGIPDKVRWAIYQEKPLEGEMPSLRERAEGALAIGDYESAAECVAAMAEEELRMPETLAVRLELAKATGHAELAVRLKSEMEKSGRDLSK